VSPQNVLATFEGAVKVIDFGIAKATAEASETRAGFMKGKYAYMSPEQCKGEPVNAQSDVFSIGIMLWEFASWRRLFKRDADFLTMRAVVEDQIPPASAFRRDVPHELDVILWKALARDRAQRYASCLELAADLETVGRQMRWDTSPAGTSRLMGELFADRLAAQEQALREAQVEGVEEFLLNADEATTIDWMERENNEDVAQSFTFGTPQRVSAPVRVQRISAPVPAQRISAPVPAQRMPTPPPMPAQSPPAARATPPPQPAQRPRDETSVTDPQRPAAPSSSLLFWLLVLLLAAAAAVAAYLIVNRTLHHNNGRPDAAEPRREDAP
jgi:serine/threonine protein kinase